MYIFVGINVYRLFFFRIFEGFFYLSILRELIRVFFW